MPARIAAAQVARVRYEATVLWAVPCGAHGVYVAGCVDCLTGEQAARRGCAQRVDELGVIASSEERLPLVGAVTAASVTALDGFRRLLNRMGVS